MRKPKNEAKTSAVYINMSNIDAIVTGTDEHGKHIIEFVQAGLIVRAKDKSTMEEFDTIEEANKRAKELASVYFDAIYIVD